jgi:enoyl-CoA hydratase/carnithine racemase
VKEEFMPYQALTLGKKGSVTIINIIDTLNPPIKISQLANELTEICTEITWDESIKVVVLTGTSEKSFSMGIDLISTVSGIKEEDKTKFWSLADPIAKLDRPVIAAISGDAIGQGLELALACDIRIGSETSYFGLPEIIAGHIPWDGGTQRLPRLVGRGKAIEMILTGEMIDAQEAYRIGLINKVVSPGELMAVAMDMAREMSTKGPISLRYAKEAIYKGMDLTMEQGLHLEADLYLLLHTTKDRTEGINAFLEKRTPKFEGK